MPSMITRLIKTLLKIAIRLFCGAAGLFGLCSSFHWRPSTYKGNIGESQIAAQQDSLQAKADTKTAGLLAANDSPHFAPYPKSKPHFLFLGPI